MCDSDCSSGNSATLSFKHTPATLVSGNQDFSDPLDNCESDCDNDSECKGTLKCQDTDSASYVPGCIGKTSTDWDFCYDDNPSMTVQATNVNKYSVIDANWNTTKRLITKMAASSPSTSATKNVPITVVPCAVTAVSTITKLEAEVGSSSTLTHSATSYTNSESNATHCGAITYELVNTLSGLSYDPSTRTLTFDPTAISSEQTF